MDIYSSDSLDFVFKHVAKMHHQTIHGLLSGKEVYPGQPPLLHQLAHQDGQSQKELAEKLQIAPATVTVMIGRLEKNGMVERRTDPWDQRVSRVYLTDRGREMQQELMAVRETMERICFEHFTTEERVIFRRLLLQMYENLKKADLNKVSQE